MGLLMLLLPLASLVSFVGYVWLVRNAFRSSTGWGVAVLLLSPISAIVFAIKFWEESKKPFLVYCGGAAGGVVLMVMMFGALGGFQAMSMASDMANGEFTEEQAVEFIDGQVQRIEAAGMLDAQGQADLERVKSALNQMTGEATADDAGEMGAGAPADNDVAVDGQRGYVADPELRDDEAEQALADALKVRATAVVRDNRRAPAGPVRVQDAGRYVGERVMVVGTDGLEHKGRMVSADGRTIWLEQYFSGGTFSVELRRSQIRSMEILD